MTTKEKAASTHSEIAGDKQCHSINLFMVREGLQCGCCGAVTRDHGQTWEPCPQKPINLKVGDKVLCNGYEGFVRRVLSGQLSGMIEVRLDRGEVCVASSTVKLLSAGE